MRKATLFVTVLAVMMCAGARAQVFPTVVSYPAYDSGWSFVGNVTNLGCGGSCAMVMSDNQGNATTSAWNHTEGNAWETPANKLLQVQSNNQPSYMSLLFSAPSTQQYKIAVYLNGQESNNSQGHLVYPTVQVYVGGSQLNLCRYPNDVSITAVNSITVDQRGKGVTQWEYVESCSVNIFAGNNTLSVQIGGGVTAGGLLGVREVIVYPTNNSGLSATIGCQHPFGNWEAHGYTTSTNGDLFGTTNSIYAGAVGDHTTGFCKNNNKPIFINLDSQAPVSTGCFGGGICRLLDVD